MLKHEKLTIRRTGCCGMRIVIGIQYYSPQEVVNFVARAMYYNTYNAAFIVFSRERGSKGQKLADFIVANDLGKIKMINKTFIWEVASSKARAFIR